MHPNILINGLTAVHGGSQGKLLTEDVCKSGGKCKSKNFQNLAESVNADKTAGTVLINGYEACHAKSNFKISQGDEPGSCGGVNSGTTQQMAEFITFSNNVLIEGQYAVRDTDLMVSNLRNTPPQALMQPPAEAPPDLEATDAEATGPAESPFMTDWEVAGHEPGILKGRTNEEDQA